MSTQSHACLQKSSLFSDRFTSIRGLILSLIRCSMLLKTHNIRRTVVCLQHSCILCDSAKHVVLCSVQIRVTLGYPTLLQHSNVLVLSVWHMLVHTMQSNQQGIERLKFNYVYIHLSPTRIICNCSPDLNNNNNNKIFDLTQQKGTTIRYICCFIFFQIHIHIWRRR